MLTIKNVKKSFPDLFAPVLNGIDLSLKPGDFCTLIGANGCGKSTLLKLISGEYTADSGSVETNGKVAQVVQDVNLGTIPDMTLLENIALIGTQKPRFSFYKRYKNQTIQKLKGLNISLEDYIDKPLKTLSGGQRQMVATLMAMTSGCKILLLDEHTSALDPKMQHLLMEYTASQVAKLGLTSLMITHRMDDAIKYGNRLVMLHKGKIVLDVSGAEKQTLKAKELIKLFHKYEDETLTFGDNHDY